MTSLTRNQATKQRGVAQANTSSATSASKPGDSETDCMLTAKTLSESLERLRESICDKIGGDIRDLRENLKVDIDSVRSELTASVANVQASLTSQDARIKDLERAADFSGDCVTQLNSTVMQLQKTVKELQTKCEDLEGRSRRNNLRLIGIEEGVEQGQPIKFVSDLLQDILELDGAPLLDRAHRSLRAKPKPGEPPRVFIMRVHYTHVRDEILRKSSLKPLMYNGKKVYIFPDYTFAVSKKRSAFGEVKKRLRAIEGVKFGLRFPATLRVTFPGKKEHSFVDPALAMDFVNRELGGTEADDN